MWMKPEGLISVYKIALHQKDSDSSRPNTDSETSGSISKWHTHGLMKLPDVTTCQNIKMLLSVSPHFRGAHDRGESSFWSYPSKQIDIFKFCRRIALFEQFIPKGVLCFIGKVEKTLILKYPLNLHNLFSSILQKLFMPSWPITCSKPTFWSLMYESKEKNLPDMSKFRYV